MMKKDYELVASAFAAFNGKVMTHREKALIIKLATAMANRMRGDNCKFDLNKFMQACNLPKVDGFCN